MPSKNQIVTAVTVVAALYLFNRFIQPRLG